MSVFRIKQIVYHLLYKYNSHPTLKLWKSALKKKIPYRFKVSKLDSLLSSISQNLKITAAYLTPAAGEYLQHFILSSVTLLLSSVPSCPISHWQRRPLLKAEKDRGKKAKKDGDGTLWMWVPRYILPTFASLFKQCWTKQINRNKRQMLLWMP